jgi:hypothetical protein
VIGGRGSSGGARDCGLAHLRLSWWRETLHREIDRFARSSRGGRRAQLETMEERQGVGAGARLPGEGLGPFYRRRKEARAEKNLGQETLHGDTSTARARLSPRLVGHLNRGGAHLQR